MTATASDAFFWTDWLGDPELRMCSFPARGVWMDLLCLAAGSKQYGFVLINGKRPSTEELQRVIGGSIPDIEAALAELEKWGVYSIDRRGVIYCRRMIKASKRRAAGKKGGEIGGKITYENKRGIFSTQGPTQGGTQGDTQEPTHPIPSHRKKVRSSSSITNGRVGSGNGEENTTIKDPQKRLAIFQNWLADRFGDRQAGWLAIMSAADPRAKDHKDALELCKMKAREGGKGWPTLWPK